MSVLRNLDLVLLALALPVFVVAGLPLLGYATALVIWLMWRAIGAYAERKAREATDLARVAAITSGSVIGRGWLLGLTLVGAGLAAGDDVGLSAAILCVVLFTVSFTTRLVLRPIEGTRSSTP
ncbi:MAG TPA: hypothetical protein VGO81_19445 [Solirubrobacteraceae bacterium]|nr:hypothetical protein [Solirubrobacteraceae bacterium]